MRILNQALTVAALMCWTSLGWAEPLVNLKDGVPAPAVVQSWSGTGKKITLTLRPDADVQAVAAAIETSLDRTRVKVRAGELLVIGLSRDDLLKALTEVELGGDDLDVLAAAAEAEDDFDTGSSLRAKKTAALVQLLKNRQTAAVGRVVGVKSGSFPKTRVAIRVLRGPTGKLGQSIRKGQTINFWPVFQRTKGGLDLNDEATIANLGAWYLKKDDQVQIKVGKKVDGGYEADLILR